MTEIVVTTQAELDAALNDPAITYADHEIMIQSSKGLWIVVKDSRGKDVRAGGSATVRAWDNATVRAGGSATVEAGIYVPVHVYGTGVILRGGIPIRPESVKTITSESWCAAQLVTVDADGMAHLYKAVNSDGESDWGGIYIVGETTDDTRNWSDDRECGHGLHACPTPFLAQQHFKEAVRFFEVTCPVESLRPIDSTKCKAPRLHVLREVDIDGHPLDGEGDRR